MLVLGAIFLAVVQQGLVGSHEQSGGEIEESLVGGRSTSDCGSLAFSLLLSAMNDRKWSYNTSAAEGLPSMVASASERSVTISCSKTLVSSVPQTSGTPVSRSPS